MHITVWFHENDFFIFTCHIFSNWNTQVHEIGYISLAKVYNFLFLRTWWRIVLNLLYLCIAIVVIKVNKNGFLSKITVKMSQMNNNLCYIWITWSSTAFTLTWFICMSSHTILHEIFPLSSCIFQAVNIIFLLIAFKKLFF